jgi:hypothetical protein
LYHFLLEHLEYNEEWDNRFHEYAELRPEDYWHEVLDDFWKLIGEFIGSLHYFRDVNMEHLHWMNGKAPMDETYATNTPQKAQKDKYEYGEYLKNQLYADIDKLNEAFGL